MKDHLKHSLKMRHILMMSLGSAIGTGLFFGVADSIKLTGPSILLAYLIGGTIMYIVIRALGEMIVHDPNVGSLSYYAYKYLGNYAGFISGWNYWFNYIVVCMLELTATGFFLDYWISGMPHWAIALVILSIFGVINILQVKFFGEFEFWFAGIKVVTIIILIVFGLYIILFDQNIHTNSINNINNLLHKNNIFANGFSGFLFSFVVVIFSFGGTELIGIAAGETKNPGKSIPIAINGIILRIIIFYIGTLSIIMLLYPWNKIGGDISPFVEVFQKIGIHKAANIMNLIAITAALSSLNSGIYSTGRMLYNLGQQNNAPKFVTKITPKGVPVNATFISIIFIFATVILNYLYPKQIFQILLAIATSAAIINWLFILITQLIFRYNNKSFTLNYKLFFFPITSIIAILFFMLIIITMMFMPNMRYALFIAPLWLIILSFCYYIKKFRKHYSEQ